MEDYADIQKGDIIEVPMLRILVIHKRMLRYRVYKIIEIHPHAMGKPMAGLTHIGAFRVRPDGVSFGNTIHFWIRPDMTIMGEIKAQVVKMRRQNNGKDAR